MKDQYLDYNHLFYLMGISFFCAVFCKIKNSLFENNSDSNITEDTRRTEIREAVMKGMRKEAIPMYKDACKTYYASMS